MSAATREPLSVIVLTWNEESNVGACLDSVAWADERLVVDSGSTDRTVELARARGARVLPHTLESFARQRNWALEQAAHRWILFLDADERVTPPLTEEIQAVLAEPRRADGYWIHRRNRFLGKPVRHAGWDRDRVLRLLDREKGEYPEAYIHEEATVSGVVATLRNPLEHETATRFGTYLEKMRRYAEWGARELDRRGESPGFANRYLRPLVRFVRMYVFQAGFLDGTTGLTVSLLGAFSVFAKYEALADLRRARSGGPPEPAKGGGA